MHAAAAVCSMSAIFALTSPSTRLNSPPGPTIVIDPGHGGGGRVNGSDGNHAVGPNIHLKEKDLTLQLSIKVAELLNQKGYNVMLTRNDDSNLGLGDRAQVASNNAAAVFLSIHFNGANDGTIQGTETYVHPAAGADSKLFATALLHDVLAVNGYANRGVKSNNYGVLSPGIQSPATAACLLETSFLSDGGEEAKLNTADYQARLATAIAKAIIDFINKATGVDAEEPTPGDTPANEGDA
jgi:N-acetylmuramoyl-L-alanine amidase